MAPKNDAKRDVPKEKKDRKEKPAKVVANSIWESVYPVAETGGYTQGKIQLPRMKVQEKDEGLLKIKRNDIIADQMKKTADEKKKQKQVSKRMKREEDDEDEDDNFQIMDKSGLGNFMEKHEVLGIMKNTIIEACSSAGTRCQIVSKPSAGDLVFAGEQIAFNTLGDFTGNKGFVMVRGPLAEPCVNIVLARPATIYVLMSATSGKSDDPYLKSWKALDKGGMAVPEFDGAAEIVEVRKNVCKDPNVRNHSLPKPPAGMTTVLLFVRPDFHAEVWPEDQKETEEEAPASQCAEVAVQHAGKVVETKTKKAVLTLEEQIEVVLAKVANGEKLTNKEKRLHEKHLEKNPQNAGEKVHSALNVFSLSHESSGKPPPSSGDAFVCNNFTLQAPGQTLFRNASISIAQGKRYGILGSNGMGKTTILRHIASRDMPVPLDWDVILVEQEAKASERTAVEEVMAADIKTVELLKREEVLVKRLEEMDQAMEKDVESVSPEDLMKTRNELEVVAADLDASGAESKEATVRKILCGLGFTAKSASECRFSMDRPVIQFSGGLRMRISLAKALFLQPRLLMLDEPTNHLDLDAVLWLDHYLSEQYPHSVIVVSHDADFLDSICTDILHLEGRQLVHYRGDYTAFKKMHNQKRQQFEKDYKTQQDAIKALTKKGDTMEDAIAKVKKRFGVEVHEKLMERGKDYIVKFNFHGHGMDRTLGLNVSEVSFSYDDKEPWLLEDCEIGVDCASRIAIVGPNGAGKSTLLNLMMKHLEPCLGEVAISKGIRVRQYHQHFEELLPLDKTGVEYLTNAYDLGVPEKARSVLGQFGLPGASHFTKIGNLSGGQKARVAFAALMLQRPHILVLDEPTNHLDIESVQALADALCNFKGGLVLVTHDARLIAELDCELWVVENGGCYRFEKGFDGYRNKVLDQLAKKEEEVELMEQRRREERAKKRAKHVSEQAMKEKAAQKKAEAIAGAEEEEEGREPKNKSSKKKVEEAGEREEEEEKPKKKSKKRQGEVEEEEEEEAEAKKLNNKTKKTKQEEEEEEEEVKRKKKSKKKPVEEEEEEKPKNKSKKQKQEEEEEEEEEDKVKPKKKSKKKMVEEEEEEEKPKNASKGNEQEEEEEEEEEDKVKPNKKSKNPVEKEEEEKEEKPKKRGKTKPVEEEEEPKKRAKNKLMEEEEKEEEKPKGKGKKKSVDEKEEEENEDEKPQEKGNKKQVDEEESHDTVVGKEAPRSAKSPLVQVAKIEEAVDMEDHSPKKGNTHSREPAAKAKGKKVEEEEDEDAANTKLGRLARKKQKAATAAKKEEVKAKAKAKEKGKEGRHGDESESDPEGDATPQGNAKAKAKGKVQPKKGGKKSKQQEDESDQVVESEPEKDEDDDDEEEAPWKEAKREALAKAKAGGKGKAKAKQRGEKGCRGKGVVRDDDGEAEKVGESIASATGGAKAKAKGKAQPKKPVVESSEDEPAPRTSATVQGFPGFAQLDSANKSEEEEEEAPPFPKSKSEAKKESDEDMHFGKQKKKTKAKDESDEEELQEEEEKQKKKPKKKKDEFGEEGEEDKPKKTSKKKKQEGEEEEEEEEKPKNKSKKQMGEEEEE